MNCCYKYDEYYQTLSIGNVRVDYRTSHTIFMIKNYISLAELIFLMCCWLVNMLTSLSSEIQHDFAQNESSHGAGTFGAVTAVSRRWEKLYQ